MSGIWNRTLVYLGLREEPEEVYEELPERFDPEDDPHAEHAPRRPAARAEAEAVQPAVSAPAGRRSSVVGRDPARETAREPSREASRVFDDTTATREMAAVVGDVDGGPDAPPRGSRAGGSGGRDERARGRESGREERSRSRESAREGRTRPAEGSVDAGEESNVRSLYAGSDVHVRAVPSSPVARAAVVELEVFDDVEAVGARYRTGQPVLFDVSGTDRTTGRRVVDFVSGLTFALRGRLTKVGTGAFLLIPDGVALSDDERRRLSDLGYRLPTSSDA